MKKTFLLLALLLGLGAQAQNLEPIGKCNLGVKRAQHAVMAGHTEGGHYYLAYSKPSQSTFNEPLFVAKYNENFKQVKKRRVPTRKFIRLRDARMARGDLTLLLQEYTVLMKRPAYYLARIDTNTLKFRGAPEPILVAEHTKDEGVRMNHAHSPNGQYHALLSITTNNASKKSVAQISVFDSAYAPLWSRTVDNFQNSGSFRINDEGIVLFIKAKEGRASIDVRVDAFLPDDSVTSQRTIALPELGNSWTGGVTLVGESDGRLLWVGHIGANRTTRGCFAVAYNYLDDKELGHDAHFFTDEEYSDFSSIRPTNKRSTLYYTDPFTSESGIPHVAVRNVTATPYGAAFAMYYLNRSSKTTYDSQHGNRTTEYDHYLGSFLYGVDTLGHFRWSNFVPTCILNPYVHTINSWFHLSCDGSQVLFIQDQHPSLSHDKVSYYRHSYLKYFHSGNLAFHTITPDGTLRSTYQQAPQPMARTFRLGNRRYLLTSDRNHSKMYIINTEK